MSSLHIAIDCRVVGTAYPGIGRATLETVRALAAAEHGGRLSLLVGPSEPPADLPALEAAHAGRVRIVSVGAALRSPGDQWLLPRLLARLRPDVYHATYYAVPVRVPGRLVVTIYDLIPRLFPHYWPNPVVRASINAWTAYAARHAQRVVACSQSTADDLARLLPQTARKTRVAPLGVAPRPPASAPESQAPAAPYLLYVGSNKPHKNLPRLVAAFAKVAQQAGGNLVIAGAWDERYPQAKQEADRPALNRRVIFEHYPSDARIAQLYTGASGFVFPSRYEGFGLPVLEAMAAGLPVATTDRGALREVAGDAALLFDSDDTDSIAGALRRLLTDGDERARLAARGRERAALFPWSRTARETWAVYEEVAAMHLGLRS